jgi:TolA-binding protein
MEKKKYNEAIGEYKRLLRLYPKSPYNYKSQFMIGFVYSEYLKNEELANAAFQKVLSEYPKCDLADDAEFMLKGGVIPGLTDEAEKDSVKTPKKPEKSKTAS